MKFSEKLKAKLRDRNFKKGAIKAATTAVLATAVVTFAACNKTGPTPTPTPTPTPGPDTSYTASQILEENTAYQNLNLTNAVFDELQQNVAKQFNVAKDKVEIVDMHFDKQNTNRATVVAKIGGEKVVTASYQNQKIAELHGANKKDLVLEEAGYTADQKVEKSQRAEVDAKFTQAVQKILDEIKAIENITPERVNEIFAGVSGIQLPSSFTDGYDFAVVSGVREDRTVVVFTGKNGKFEDHVLSVDGKENMTNEEILATIKSGTGFSKTTRTIDPSKKYEAPALEEIQVQYVDFDTVYNEIFGKGYALTAPTKLLQNVMLKINSDFNENKLLFVTNDGSLILYSEGVDALGRKVFSKAQYKGADQVAINQYFSNSEKTSEDLKKEIKDKYMSKDIVVGSDEERDLKENLKNYKNDLEQCASDITNIEKSDFTRTKIFTSTKDSINQSAFGAKLCEGKEVIATYVGAMSTRLLDSSGRFDTGYYTTFETTVVYKENDQIVIKKDKIYVPYYNNSTNESLYNTFLSDTDGTKHDIVSISTEVVNNPVIATKNGKKAEYNISFESKNTQLASIASSEISQRLKNEEDSLSR